jgi:hypothetical protein
MNTFNFSEEMVYGKKHLDTLLFNTEKYNMYSTVENLFQCDLSKLHTTSTQDYPVLTTDMLGKDSHTEFHKLFYSTLNNGWTELVDKYNLFIKEVISPYLHLNEFLYQKYPTFRIHLPNNTAICIKHYDSDELHKHPKGEINFIYALTDMYDTNTIWVEKMPRLEEFLPIHLKLGECICFNGNICNHVNKINKTGKTRISFDFRILPLNYYNPDSLLQSVTTQSKYIEGGYYLRFKNTQLNLNYDFWNSEKQHFNKVLKKYNLIDPWDVVDLFEKTLANYAGSKYAVSVDNCTNALFLCLKYLKASGTVTIPSRTWISVPCTIIHAGCKVQFEDIEWSGMYQLKPYPIYDGAVRMKKNMYQKNMFHCLSFHIRKHIPIGKGGMILTDDFEAYNWFKIQRYEGRTLDGNGNYLLYKDDNIKSLGYNMYMTPEQASRGLELFEKKIKDDNPDQESSGSCKDLSKLNIYTS